VVVSRPTLEKVLSKGQSLGIVVGGEEECLLTENGKDRVVLGGRKGFVKLALKHGTRPAPRDPGRGAALRCPRLPEEHRLPKKTFILTECLLDEACTTKSVRAQQRLQRCLSNGCAGAAGADLVPTYCFFNNDTFHISKSLLAGPRAWLKRHLKLSIPVFWGRRGPAAASHARPYLQRCQPETLQTRGMALTPFLPCPPPTDGAPPSPARSRCVSPLGGRSARLHRPALARRSPTSL
jgi:hypothetical protein